MIPSLIARCVRRSEELGQVRERCDVLNDWHRNLQRIASVPRMWLGSESAWVPAPRKGAPHAGTRWVDKATFPVTSGEVARLWLREYLADHGSKSGRFAWRSHQAQLFASLSPPHYFYPPEDRNGPWAYVDLNAAYFSLYQPMSFTLDFNPTTRRMGYGRFDARPTEPLGSSKLVRNSLYGCLVGSRIPEIRQGKWQSEANCAPNPYFAPGLCSFVLLALHSIAQEARTAFEFVSWSTDGGITRPDNAPRFIAWLAEHWGLTAEVRAEGPGYVWGRNCHSVGGVETADVARGEAKPARLLRQKSSVSLQTQMWMAESRLARVS